MAGTSPAMTTASTFARPPPRVAGEEVLLLRCEARRRAHRLQSVDGSRRDRGAHHVARFVRRPWPAAMHGGAIVPHHHVAGAPGMDVGRAGSGGRGGEFVD